MDNTKEELNTMCKSIAEELDGYAYGELIYSESEGGFIENDDEHEDDGLYSWLSNDALDIKVLTDLDGKEIYGARICVTFGGPNIYVDTDDGLVKGYWGCAGATAELSGSICDTINDMIAEIRGC